MPRKNSGRRRRSSSSKSRSQESNASSVVQTVTEKAGEFLQENLNQRISEARENLNERISEARRIIGERASTAKQTIMETAEKARRGDKKAIAQLAAPTLLAAAAVGTSIKIYMDSRGNGRSRHGRNGRKAAASKSNMAPK